MKQLTLTKFADLLRRQREHYLREFRKAEEGLESIDAEREIELEEHAQEEQMARYLSRLDDHTLYEVKEIDSALQRIIDGAYGKCESCHRAIAQARLRALPATRLCAKCAARNERKSGAAPVESETPAAASIPADLSLLSDRELAEAINEHLKEDGRLDTAELRVVVRRGVVFLTGILPSETEHQVLRHIVTDVVGLKEVVDHIQLETLLWERQGRTKEPAPEVTQPGQEAPGTEDIVESTEEGEEYVAPAKPTAEPE
jgi:RNA polymerase-binding transcription factor DksA